MSVNQIEENELKLGETVNAIKILSTAVLLGVKRAIDRYGNKHNIPHSLRMQMISGIQKGGQTLINSYNRDQIKQLGADKLKEFGKKIGITDSDIESLKDENNPDYQKGVISLVASKTFSNAKTLYISFIKKIIIVTDYFVSRIIDYVTEDTFNKPINELTTNTNKRVLALAAYLRAVSNNPEQMKAISEISEALGDLGIEFIDSIRPALDKMVEKLNETSVKVASQAASGAMRTFIAIGTSLIAEVPGLGGVIDLIISIAIGFNSAMRVFRTFVTNNASLAEYGAEALNNSIQSVKKNSGRLISGIDKFKKGLSSDLSNVSLKGGSIKSNLNKMSKSRKRIQFSVHKFKELNCHSQNPHRHCRTKKHIHY